MADPAASRTLDASDPQARLARRAWLLFGGSITLLSLAALAALGLDGPRPLDVLLALLVAVAAVTAIVHHRASTALEAGRRGEAVSFARILQALSRSVSPDAVVAAIVEELGAAAVADHVAFVRLRPATGVLDATLVTMRPGVPASMTVLSADLLQGRDRAVDEPSAVPVGAVTVPVGAVTVPALELAVPAAAAGAATPAPLAWPGPGAGAVDAPAGEPRERPMVDAGSTGPVPEARAAAARIATRVGEAYGLRNVTSAPLVTEAGVVGAIVLSRRTDEAWSAASRGLLEGAASEASAALSRLYSQREAETRAATDALTGLPNRRYFDEFCGLLARRRRAADAVGVMMIDIDHFKRLNDRHGHTTGDAVLRAVAGAIGRSVRDDDVPARYGGEEFVVLLRSPGPGVAVEIGQRVRWAVRSLDLGHLGVGMVTVSVGVGIGSAPGEPVERLVEQADRALYRAKREGRDRVVG